jgi:hypothetical protein
LYEKLNELKWGPFGPRPFGIFPMIAINYNIVNTCHRDKNDDPNSLCCLITLGDYEDDELCFSELKIIISLKPNQVLVFSSYFLLHGNLPVIKGIRHSIVYKVHNAFFYNKNALTKIYNNSEIETKKNTRSQQNLYNAHELNFLKTLKKANRKQKDLFLISSNTR